MASGSDSLRQSLDEDSKHEEAWKAVMDEVNVLDDGLIGGQKEDIDTLLVFAGLFSAVVTSFTIESYKWLSEDPQNATVALLKRITDQMVDGTSTASPEFEVSLSDVRINIMWFLSLIISLVVALFGLLCKQWLREHHRHTHTCTPAEALALRWLRHESLERWRVPTILACLPVSLELALFLFLGGIIELLRTRHLGLFITASAVVGSVGLIYLATTIIPGVHIIRQVLQVTREVRSEDDGKQSYVDRVNNLRPMESICPYKSPQAWWSFSTFAAFTQLRGIVQLIHYLQAFSRSEWLKSASAFQKTMGTLEKWSSVDLEVIHRPNASSVPPFYELKAYRWLVAELQDSETMRPHLQRILEEKPLHLVMPAVFNRWFVHPDGKWLGKHIGEALSLPRSTSLSTTLDPLKNPMEQNKLFDRLLHWTHISAKPPTAMQLDAPKQPLPELLRSIWTDLLHDVNNNDNAGSPFSIFDEILEDEKTSGAGSDLWDLLIGIGQLHSTGNQYWQRLMRNLARHIVTSSDYALHENTASTTSPLVTSKPDLICQAHNLIIDRKIWNTVSMDETMEWIEAMDIVRRVHWQAQQPQNSLVLDFKTIPEHFPLPLSKLRKTLRRSSSPAGSRDTDFAYLASFQEHWDAVKQAQRECLIEILSEHINDYIRPFPSGNGSLPPLVQSADGPGLDLIRFLNNQLNRNDPELNRTFYERLDLPSQEAWSELRKHIPQLAQGSEGV
ncbi:hypothetical protein PQX77_000338 [Marasmius sp. AFHP31]|nr:hypothetical protein PQX77_000338 [Marasmius sp. AFHP31]